MTTRYGNAEHDTSRKCPKCGERYKGNRPHRVCPECLEEYGEKCRHCGALYIQRGPWIVPPPCPYCNNGIPYSEAARENLRTRTKAEVAARKAG